MEERVEFALEASRGEKNFASLCREYGISRPTGYLWRERYLTAGTISGLVEKSRRPKYCPHRTSREKEVRVIELRKKWGWGARKLQVLLRQEHDLELSVRTINRVIERNGLVAEEDRVNQATKRFERDKPNELWQMDFKGEFRDFVPHCFPLTILDDHSRYNLEIKALNSTNAVSVDKSIKKVFEEYGVPESMLMDHGSPWWSTHSEHGLTQFSISLIKQGIKLHYSGVGHPQTQGKLERFHRTLKREVRHRGAPKKFKDWQKLFNEIRHDYNHIRPHESLAMKTPSTRYKKSKKQYQPHPKDWEYPQGSLVKEIDLAGCLRYKTAHLFVSHSLVGEKVRLYEANNQLVVGYRHMVVREIDLKTGHGKPVVRSEL